MHCKNIQFTSVESLHKTITLTFEKIYLIRANLLVVLKMALHYISYFLTNNITFF